MIESFIMNKPNSYYHKVIGGLFSTRSITHNHCCACKDGETLNNHHKSSELVRVVECLIAICSPSLQRVIHLL